MKTKKRFVSLFLSAVMALSLLPSAAFAVEAPETGEQPTVAVSDDVQTQAGSADNDVLVTSDADTTEGEVTTDDTSTATTVEPEITWSRTKELNYIDTGLGELYAGAKSNYENINGSSGRPTSAYFEWSWNTISKVATSLTGDTNVWDFGTSNQYTNTKPSQSDLGIAFDSKTDTAGIAATWNNRVREAVTVYDDSGKSDSYKKGQFDDYSDQTSSGKKNDKSYTVRKISGTFIWPEGYDLSDNTELVSANDANYQKIYDYIDKDSNLKSYFGGKRVLAINDDVYAFIYKDGDNLTSSNYMDYMAFWTGTAGKGVWSPTTGQAYAQKWGSTWNMTDAPATYGGEYAVRAFQNVVPNMATSALDWDKDSNTNPTRKTVYDSSVGVPATALKQSDGWYSFMDGNSLSTVLANQYANQDLSNQKFHIDFYCFDTDKVGGMDKLKLQMTKATPDEVNVTVRYWLDSVETTTDRNYLGETIMTSQKIGDEITLADGTDVNQLNHKRAAAITLNNGRDVEPGEQQDPVPFTVTKDSSRNIIDVVYKSNEDIRTVVYTYDFGVQNSYAKLLENAGVQNRDSVTVTVPDDYQSYIKYDKQTDTISYTPQSINIRESVLLTLTRTVNRKTELMYLRVHFLPETNVLYEETFMDDSKDNSVWEYDGTNNASTVATDNGDGSVYGYTSAYNKTSNNTFSNGGAYKTHFVLQGDQTSLYSTSDKVFTFKGTGFDLISECGTDTGMLIVGIKDVETDKTVKGYIVDTYFSGDDVDGSIISGQKISAYQIPVVRAMGLDYKEYEVTVRGYFTTSAGAAVNFNSNIARTQSAASSEKELAKSILRDAGMSEYSKNVELSYMDDNSVLNGGTGVASNTTSAKRNSIARTTTANSDPSATVYIDGVRIYQPRHDNESGYVEQEKNLKYGSIYDYLTANDDIYTDNEVTDSAVYVETDGDTLGKITSAIIADYKKQGPENEVYLTSSNFVGFALKGYKSGQTVMVSAKSINQGSNATLSAIKPSGNDSETTVVKELKQCGTEMYYDVTDYVFEKDGTYYLILGNADDDKKSVLSISGIKLPNDTTSFSSAETSNTIARMVSLAYQEDSTFVPKYFKVSAKSSVKAGKSTTIKATASTTVDHIAIYTNAKCTKPVNSKTKAIQPDNKKAVRKGTAKRYTFHASVKIAKKQKYSFYVVAYDKNGNASDPVKVSITGKR